MLIVGLLVASAGPLGADARLSMKVSPPVALAPANLTMRAIIVPDSRNRMLQITAESGDYYRSSDIQTRRRAGAAYDARVLSQRSRRSVSSQCLAER